MSIYSNKPDEFPATSLLQSAIDYAHEDPDDLARVETAIRLLRKKQLARADVQERLARIFEKKISQGGRQ